MRTRAAAAVVALLAAVSLLSACRTNVGYAATVDGARYSESDISGYLTPDAQAVSEQGSDGSSTSVPTRSFVVETLIVDKLFAKVLDRLPGGAPSQDELNTLKRQGLKGQSEQQVATASGIKGYTDDFTKLWVRTRVDQQYLSLAQQRGVDIRSAITGLQFPVSVNPRYGTWDASTFSLDSAAGAGAPAFLQLQGGSGGTESLSPTGTGG